MENIKFKERKAFNFYRSYYETSLLLDGKDKAEFFEIVLIKECLANGNKLINKIIDFV